VEGRLGRRKALLVVANANNPREAVASFMVCVCKWRG
jgi:hypothetical protein